LNVIDKAIAAINPEAALRREFARVKLDAIDRIRNSGYSESGASHQKKSVKGWTASSKSPQEDIDANLNTLRQRSRSLYMSAPVAVSALKTNRTNIVGAGLKLKSRIDYVTLGITQEQAQSIGKKIEREFSLWADSKFSDALRINNFYENQQLALLSWLLNGDAFAIRKTAERKPYMPYSLRVHLIEADRISTPSNAVKSSYNATDKTIGENKDNNNPIYNGVEIDKETGAIVAYWISDRYPNTNNKTQKINWTRVEAVGEKTGDPNILQLMESERCEQYRGLPYLTPVIETLKQISRYTEAELTAAVVQAFFTAFIKYEGNKNTNVFNDVIPEDEQVDKEDPNAYEMGAGTINVLGPGEDIVFADPKRPASGFEMFFNTMTRQIGAALELPADLLTKAFNSSYSASRAAMLEAWKAFRMRRGWFANDFCQPIYDLWLSEAVALGRIKAPGFFNDPLIKKAWCNAEWIGPAQGMLDPTKEVEAATKRVEQGYSTRERETTELTGGNWDDNVAQIQKENEQLSKIKPIEKGGNQNDG
jgi:lambda family phage portal protein